VDVNEHTTLSPRTSAVTAPRAERTGGLRPGALTGRARTAAADTTPFAVSPPPPPPSCATSAVAGTSPSTPEPSAGHGATPAGKNLRCGGPSRGTLATGSTAPPTRPRRCRAHRILPASRRSASWQQERGGGLGEEEERVRRRRTGGGDPRRGREIREQMVFHFFREKKERQLKEDRTVVAG
jgi:hypothetical protein